MCGYYLLIKHLHGNMTSFSTWDRGLIDQISPLSIASYVYAFWMNVLGTGTPSLPHLLYMRQELSHTFLHHCNGIWHTSNPYGLLMFTLHDGFFPYWYCPNEAVKWVWILSCNSWLYAIWKRQCSWSCYLWVAHSKYLEELSVLLFFIHIIICANVYNISIFSLPNKVAIERASTSSKISLNLRSPSFHEKSGNSHKHFLVCSWPEKHEWVGV